MSGCKELQSNFENRVDAYNYTAQLYLGKENWEKLSKKEKKELRGKFKVVTLGLMYGLGTQSLASRLFCTVEEAQKLIDVFYTAYPRVKDYIREQGDYIIEHGGYINTLFGNKIQPEEWKYYLNAPTQREKKNQEARLKRLGVNLPIQGGTSLAMSSGFNNDLRVAVNQGWNLTSFITVHEILWHIGEILC